MTTPNPQRIREEFHRAIIGVEDEIYGQLLGRLNNRIADLDIKLEPFACMLGVTQGTLSKYLNDRISISVRKLIRMLLLLDMKRDDLQFAAYVTAVLEGYRAAVHYVRKVQDPDKIISITQHQVALLGALTEELSSLPPEQWGSHIMITDEVASRVSNRVGKWLPAAAGPDVSAADLTRLFREWGRAWLACLRAIAGWKEQ